MTNDQITEANEIELDYDSWIAEESREELRKLDNFGD